MDRSRAWTCSVLFVFSFHSGCGGSGEPARTDRAPSRTTASAGASGDLGAGGAAGSGDAAGAAGQLGPLQPSAATRCSTLTVVPWRPGTEVDCEFPIVWSLTAKAQEKAAVPRVDLAVDADANLYVAATLRGEADWSGERAGRAWRDNSFVASYTPEGELRFVHAIDESSVNALAVDAGRQVCVAAELLGWTDLPEVLNPSDEATSVVQCWDLEGSPRWARGLRGFIREIAFDQAGNLLVASFEANPEEISQLTTLSSFTPDGSPRWSKLLTRRGEAGTIAAHPDGSFVFVVQFADTVELGGTRVTNPRETPSAVVASIDPEGNALWTVLEEWGWLWPHLVVAPGGDILVMISSTMHRYDRAGTRLGIPVESRIDAAFAGGYLSANSSRTGSVVGWTLERFDGDLELKTVTTHEPTSGTSEATTREFGTAVVAPNGGAYIAAVHGELVAIARIDVP